MSGRQRTSKGDPGNGVGSRRVQRGRSRRDVLRSFTSVRSGTRV